MHKKPILLLVDDEDNIRKALNRVLRSEGYRILQADSGSRALKILQSHPEIGVILSDQRMPNMTGIEFLSQARQICPDAVRMILSGYTDLKTVTEAINQGKIYKFLTKPWEQDQLLANVREAFEHHQLRFENQRLTLELQQTNKALEQRVEQKTREAMINIHALQISQEVLEHLPVAVLGIDENGLLVIANPHAENLLTKDGRALIGQTANDFLLKAVSNQVENCRKGEPHHPVDIQMADKIYNVRCSQMGRTSKAQGVIVVMVPIEDFGSRI